MPARKAAEQYNVINKCAAQSRVENADDMLSVLAGAQDRFQAQSTDTHWPEGLSDPLVSASARGPLSRSRSPFTASTWRRGGRTRRRQLTQLLVKICSTIVKMTRYPQTPGGAGTHTGHADAQRHTDRTDEPHNHPNPQSTHNPHVSATTKAAADRVR